MIKHIYTIIFAITGSFCTFDSAIAAMERLAAAGHTLVPVMSETAYATDTRFGTAASFCERIGSICGRPVLATIAEAEPLGPRNPADILVVAPCTGNTLGKLAHGITDTSVTMAVKAHLRNNRPVVLAVSTNDALGASAKNIGTLLARKHIHFVPMSQDDPINKPMSMIADLDKLEETMAIALPQGGG